ncbi:MAG: suppressor of fused domain protein [Pseudomonadota bacterium]
MSEDAEAGDSPFTLHRERQRITEGADPGWPARMAALERHYARHFGPHDEVVHPWIERTALHIDVVAIPPREGRAYWTLATLGMSSRAMAAPDPALRYAEVMIGVEAPGATRAGDFLKGDLLYPVALLRALAAMPHEMGTFFAATHTTNVPDIAHADPAMDCVLFVPPFLSDESADICAVDAGEHVVILAAVPIHRAEIAFAHNRGSEALIDRFCAASVTEVYVPGRPSAVGPGLASRFLGALGLG